MSAADIAAALGAQSPSSSPNPLKEISEFRCGDAVEPRRGFQTNRRRQRHRPAERGGGPETPSAGDCVSKEKETQNARYQLPG
jgi:hypothetical protein